MAALLGGVLLRFWMFRAFPQQDGDVLVYGDLARNILFHSQFALTGDNNTLHTTLIRLPGYPLFLAACFRVFGVERYGAIAWLQILMELAACLLLADFVRRIASPRAALNTLWLAALCPFTAIFASAELTESLTFDMICLALWSLQRHLSQPKETWRWLALFTVAISSAALLRPDGALLAIALWPALLFARKPGSPSNPAGRKILPKALPKALLCATLSVMPFAAWAVRNWRAFHVFEPLAPRYATNPGEDPLLGWQHWVKTWCLDFTCTNEIYWNVPGGAIAIDDLPSTAPNPAFDSPQQKNQTAALIDEYNTNWEMSPSLDARFEALAQQRTAEHPFRTRLILPVGRLADMTLRPRIENLPIDFNWWQYDEHHTETEFSWSYAAVNLLFLALGLWGFCYRPRLWPYMAAYLVLRSLLLLTIEAPETRYTIEFFPILFALGGIALQRIFTRRTPELGKQTP